MVFPSFREISYSFLLLTGALKPILVLIWGNENVLELDSGDGYTIYEYTKNHQVVHFKIKHEFYGMLLISHD